MEVNERCVVRGLVGELGVVLERCRAELWSEGLKSFMVERIYLLY